MNPTSSTIPVSLAFRCREARVFSRVALLVFAALALTSPFARAQDPTDAVSPGGAAAEAPAPVQPSNDRVLSPVGDGSELAGCTPGAWSNSTVLPPSRYRAGGVSDGTYSYVFGGGTVDGTYLNDLWRWKPTTHSWTQLANMPTGKQNMQGAYWNGKIYVPGGYTGVHITENAIYDIATNTWTLGAPLPAAQTGATVAYNNRIYVFGGNPGPVTTVRVYDIASNTWTTGASLPAATTYGRAVVSGAFAYYVGGIAGTTTTNAVYRYSFSANSWTTVAPLQTARATAEVMASPDGYSLFAVGGGDSTFFTGVPVAQSVEIYDIANNTWSYGNPLTTAVAAPSGGLAGGELMIQGGVNGTTYPTTVQISDLVCPTPPVPSSAVSRQVHGGAGFYDINLPLVPLDGAVGVESRAGSTAGQYQMVVTFAGSISMSGVAVTSGTGSATYSIGGSIVTINLTGVTNMQRLGVTLLNANDGTHVGDVLIPMGILIGDTGGNGQVSGSDVSQTKSAAATGTVNASSFRADVSTNGTINATDIAAVKARSGTQLPP